ncbi:MAG: hypothetical protein IPH77_20760 [Ignavibacteria bacterium]|nr:hypothetical protein [Ignavibacteria bacterium]
MNTSTNKLFCSIQSAIDDALTIDGHTISISAGTYTENVILSKRLTLDGAGSGSDPSVIYNHSVSCCQHSGSTDNFKRNGCIKQVVVRYRVTGATGSSTQVQVFWCKVQSLGYYTFDNVVSS